MIRPAVASASRVVPSEPKISKNRAAIAGIEGNR